MARSGQAWRVARRIGNGDEALRSATAMGRGDIGTLDGAYLCVSFGTGEHLFGGGVTCAPLRENNVDGGDQSRGFSDDSFCTYQSGRDFPGDPRASANSIDR